MGHCIRRLKKVNPGVPVIVATSTLSENDAVAEFASDEGADVFRGSEEDVLDRFYQTAISKYCHRFIIRATADNPLVDPVEAQNVVSEIMTGKWDYIAGYAKVEGQGLPRGVGVEAFTMKALETAWKQGKKPEHREHINSYFIDNKDIFRVGYTPCPKEKSCPELNLSVDTHEDLTFVANISQALGRPLLDIRTEEIVRYWTSKHS